MVALTLAEQISRAHKVCSENGHKLTQKRAQVLQILLEHKTPLSAYEIAAQYQQTFAEVMQPMSVYRILEFLINVSLAHKIATNNKYIACSHIGENDHHGRSQFLLCRNCKAVKEIHLDPQIFTEIGEQVEAAGYQLISSHLELDCICQACAAADDTADVNE